MYSYLQDPPATRLHYAQADIRTCIFIRTVYPKVIESIVHLLFLADFPTVFLIEQFVQSLIAKRRGDAGPV